MSVNVCMYEQANSASWCIQPYLGPNLIEDVSQDTVSDKQEHRLYIIRKTQLLSDLKFYEII